MLDFSNSVDNKNERLASYLKILKQILELYVYTSFLDTHIYHYYKDYMIYYYVYHFHQYYN